MNTPRTSLDLTHVYYDGSSPFSFVLALITLTPILLMPAYAALVLQTRELTILTMWIGQFLCEGFNLLLKRIIKQGRPSTVAYGYGFPSSHSQYMGFFATFLICHFHFRHRFAPTGYRVLDGVRAPVIYLGICSLAGTVAYSRYYLGYHSPHQILWGLAIGAALGASLYLVAELLPARRPHSAPGRVRAWLLENPVSTWLELRDGWAVWGDGGRGAEWRSWRKRWEAGRKE